MLVGQAVWQAGSQWEGSEPPARPLARMQAGRASTSSCTPALPLPVKPVAGPEAARFFTVNRKGNISPRWICRGRPPGQHSSESNPAGAMPGVHAASSARAVQASLLPGMQWRPHPGSATSSHPARLTLTVTGAKSMPSCSSSSTLPLESSLKVPLICGGRGAAAQVSVSMRVAGVCEHAGGVAASEASARHAAQVGDFMSADACLVQAVGVAGEQLGGLKAVGPSRLDLEGGGLHSRDANRGWTVTRLGAASLAAGQYFILHVNPAGNAA